MKKSVISLISYDAHMLIESIKSYYAYVDEIILGLDEDRISWNNNKFSFNEGELWDSLLSIDVDNKIEVIQSNFHSSKIAIENDNYERNFLKSKCTNSWIFSFDADEVLLNAKDFFYSYCPIVHKYKEDKDVCMIWVTPFKTIGDTTLLIVNEDGAPFFGENQSIATSVNNTFTYARWSNVSASGKNRLMSPLIGLHWSLDRDKQALYEKINNTGHSDIVNEDPFFSLWNSVTLDNYKEFHNFRTSGIGPAQWPRLRAVPTKDLVSFIMSYKDKAY